MAWGREHVSLDSPVDEDGDTSLGDLMAQETAPGPDLTVLDVESRDRLNTLVEQLDERAADIIRSRYGLVDGRQHKLADIGAKHGISAERVRQLEREALQKLRRSPTPTWLPDPARVPRRGLTPARGRSRVRARSRSSRPRYRARSSSVPVLSMTYVAIARRCSRVAWAAIRDSASSRVQPRSRTIRSTCSSTGASTTIDRVEACPPDPTRRAAGCRGRPARRAARPPRARRYRSKISGCRIALERSPLGLVGEDDRAERRPVEVALGREHLVAERLDDLRPARACPRATTSRASWSRVDDARHRARRGSPRPCSCPTPLPRSVPRASRRQIWPQASRARHERPGSTSSHGVGSRPKLAVDRGGVEDVGPLELVRRLAQLPQHRHDGAPHRRASPAGTAFTGTGVAADGPAHVGDRPAAWVRGGVGRRVPHPAPRGLGSPATATSARPMSRTSVKECGWSVRPKTRTVLPASARGRDRGRCAPSRSDAGTHVVRPAHLDGRDPALSCSGLRLGPHPGADPRLRRRSRRRAGPRPSARRRVRRGRGCRRSPARAPVRSAACRNAVGDRRPERRPHVVRRRVDAVVDRGRALRPASTSRSASATSAATRRTPGDVRAGAGPADEDDVVAPRCQLLGRRPARPVRHPRPRAARSSLSPRLAVRYESTALVSRHCATRSRRKCKSTALVCCHRSRSCGRMRPCPAHPAPPARSPAPS